MTVKFHGTILKQVQVSRGKFNASIKIAFCSRSLSKFDCTGLKSFEIILSLCFDEALYSYMVPIFFYNIDIFNLINSNILEFSVKLALLAFTP